MKINGVLLLVTILSHPLFCFAGLIGSSLEENKKTFDKTREVRPYDEKIDEISFKTISFNFPYDKVTGEKRGMTLRFYEGKCVAVLTTTEVGKKFEKGKFEKLWEAEFGTEKFEVIKPKEGFYRGDRGNVMLVGENEKGRDSILLMDGRFYDKAFPETEQTTAQKPKKEGWSLRIGGGNNANIYSRSGQWLGYINNNSAWEN